MPPRPARSHAAAFVSSGLPASCAVTASPPRGSGSTRPAAPACPGLHPAAGAARMPLRAPLPAAGFPGIYPRRLRSRGTRPRQPAGPTRGACPGCLREERGDGRRPRQLPAGPPRSPRPGPCDGHRPPGACGPGPCWPAGHTSARSTTVSRRVRRKVSQPPAAARHHHPQRAVLRGRSLVGRSAQRLHRDRDHGPARGQYRIDGSGVCLPFPGQPTVRIEVR